MTLDDGTDLAVLPRVWDELWAQHGPAIRAAQLAVMEAKADLQDTVGGAW